MKIVGIVVLVGLLAVGAIACSGDSKSPSELAREKAEDCLNPWDGNHEGFEDQIRSPLRVPESMRTHETLFFPTQRGALDGSYSEIPIRMEWSATTPLGVRRYFEAVGRLNINTCEVTVVLTGVEES